ncbi:MAG TPA: phosphonate ABC transporter ATP-binding protein [Acetobacteraceae bacterium]|jgi:phosphonate transport system ATP-binding protein|nr:phosphonate ABC transporter ATP-binding protein [Acetobacteraceae bacterium]
MIAPPRLAVRDLSKRLGGRVVLSDLSLDANAHEFVAVLGPSGAGKTTLFRCLTGLLASDAGTVQLDGATVAHLRGRERRQIGVVFQQFNLVSRLTALENVLAGRLGHVACWRGWLRRFGAADHRLARDCLERVGLADFARRRADMLSGGEQQRVAIARALAQQPRLIVADEPVSSLDPDTGAAILELLRGIAESSGIAVVCSLHQVALARAYADRIVGLSHGRLVVDMAASGFDAEAHAVTYGANLRSGPFRR